MQRLVPQKDLESVDAELEYPEIGMKIPTVKDSGLKQWWCLKKSPDHLKIQINLGGSKGASCIWLMYVWTNLIWTWSACRKHFLRSHFDLKTTKYTAYIRKHRTRLKTMAIKWIIESRLVAFCAPTPLHQPKKLCRHQYNWTKTLSFNRFRKDCKRWMKAASIKQVKAPPN